jgi:hypothetical protein
MKNKSYVNIHIEGQSNIGVLDLGTINHKEGETKNATTIKQRVESKLIEALQAHFDCPVKIRLTNVISSSPIHVIVHVIIESEGQDYEEDVVLENTWIY